MKYLLSVVLICLAAHTLADDNQCKVFKCGSIPQPYEGSDVCVLQNGGYGSDYKASICKKKGEVCKTSDDAWGDPSHAPSSAICSEGTSPTWPPERVPPSDGYSLPGDYCTHNSHCFGADSDKIYWDTIINTCVSTLREGDACYDSKSCPADQYCKDSKCARAVKEGGECSVTDPCSYGLTCVASDELFEKYVCANTGAFHEGDRFKFATSVPENLLKVKTPNVAFLLTGLCKTQIAMFLDRSSLQWRKGAVSASQKLKDLERKHVGDYCDYTMTDDPDPKNYMKVTSYTSSAKCGFNKDSFYYCNPEIGDDYVTQAMEAADNELTIPNEKCHPLSGGRMCEHSYQEHVTNAVFVATRKITSAVYGSYYLIANNDKCVANTITQSYWRGHFPTKDETIKNRLE
jgi:hypothetical protein